MSRLIAWQKQTQLDEFLLISDFLQLARVQHLLPKQNQTAIKASCLYPQLLALLMVNLRSLQATLPDAQMFTLRDFGRR